MDVQIESSWKRRLAGEFLQPYFFALTSFVRQEYLTKQVYPPPAQIFHAFEACPFEGVRVVILGQDPYHGAGQAHGLCFSVNDGVALPPSLHNIYKEIRADIGTEPFPTGNLDRWAKQGVLLLNATLTVVAGSPGSHQRKGWEEFTDAVIKRLNDECEHLVFILWGAYAQKKGEVIDRSRHLVLSSPHPSPFSADKGFFGSKPFSRTNVYLREHGLKEIDWR